ncbi:MAG: radical SAM protein [Terriglobales bacterium]
MSALLDRYAVRAARHRIPTSVHIDVTYRCNERCAHCYLDHEDHGELTTAELIGVLDQLAAAGTFFLTLSGGEVLMRRDFFELVAHARRLQFDVKVKTNGVLIREAQARRLRELGVRQLQLSVYSHRPEVHDGITGIPGSLQRTLQAIRFLKDQGLNVTMANVLMRQNMDDYPGTQRLARELGVRFELDPTITPMMDGGTEVLGLRIPQSRLEEVFADASLRKEDPEEEPPLAEVLDSSPCGAGHSTCYVSPYGDVYPCVQFPLPCGNLRQQSFREIWESSPQLGEVRAIRVRDLVGCSSCGNVRSCSRCPGLAYMEGNMRGPSTTDCEKSYARTGHASVNLLAKRSGGNAASPLVQIRL